MLKVNTSTAWNIVYYGKQFSFMLIMCLWSQICDITKCGMNGDSKSRPEISCYVLSSFQFLWNLGFMIWLESEC